MTLIKEYDVSSGVFVTHVIVNKLNTRFYSVDSKTMKGAGWLSGGGWMSGGAEEYGEGMGPNGGRRSSPQASHMRFIKAYFRKNKNSSKSAVEKMKAANKLWKKSAERRSIAHKIGKPCFVFSLKT